MEDNTSNSTIEKAVLNSIIFTPEILEEITDTLQKTDFFIKAHQDIYNAIMTMYEGDSPIDEELLIIELKKNNLFNEEVFLDIISVAPIRHVGFYVETLKSLSLKRNLLSLSHRIKKTVSEGQKEATDIINEVESKLFSITSQGKKGDFKEAKEIAKDTLELIKQIKQRGNKTLVGVDTGYNELNKMTTGFGKGDLVIVAARPAMGKTAFALNCVLNLVKQKRGIAFFSLEMPSEQLMMRLLSAYTSIPLQKLRVGDMDNDHITRLSDACDDIAGAPFFVYDHGNLNISTLRSKLRRLKSTNKGIELAVIDYLQLMSGVSSSKDRHLEVSEISRGLKMLARELDIPIIALSQLNRSLEARADKRPMLSDIRESGSIEQDADIILFVYRDDVYLYKEEKEREKQAKKEGKEFKPQYIEKEEEKAEIIIGKQRNGPTGHINLMFQKKFTRFVDTSPKVTQIVYEDIPDTNIQDGSDDFDMPVF